MEKKLRGNNNKNNKTPFKSFLTFFGGLIILMTIFAAIYSSTNVKDKNYSEIISKFKNHQVVEYEMNLGSGNMEITLKNDEKIIYVAPNVGLIYDDIKGYVKEYNEQNPENPMIYNLIRPVNNSWFFEILSIISPFIIMILIFWVINNKMGMGKDAGGFGKAKMKKLSEDDKRKTKKTLFSDVAGADEEKQELAEVVDFLKNPKKYEDIGARIPKGILLIGAPGTGKTLLARAVAGEANVPFFSISGSEFVELFVGVGASRVRDLFEQAKKNSPAIIFIDEIDAVGRKRGAGLGGGHDEREQTLNQMLVEMDGFEKSQKVIVIAATNRADVLDPALLRPGRFDRHVFVNLPDVKGREEILKINTKNKKFAKEVDLKTIAKITAGFTGADLENLVNESAILAARVCASEISMSEIEEASRKISIGTEKKSKVITEKDKKITAYHEAGHAIVTKHCETQDKVHEISIIPRGWAGGYTMHLPQEDRMYMTKKEMLEDMVVYMGGRAAEELIFGEDYITTGASSDIKESSKIARKMVTSYGMSSEIGPISYSDDDEEIFIGRDIGHVKNFSESVAAKIDFEIKDILTKCYENSKKILKNNIENLHKISKVLLEKEKLSGEEFYELMAN